MQKGTKVAVMIACLGFISAAYADNQSTVNSAPTTSAATPGMQDTTVTSSTTDQVLVGSTSQPTQTSANQGSLGKHDHDHDEDMD